jgi:hypothetical protein
MLSVRVDDKGVHRKKSERIVILAGLQQTNGEGGVVKMHRLSIIVPFILGVDREPNRDLHYLSLGAGLVTKEKK